MAKDSYKRRMILIDKSFQLRLVGLGLVYGLIVVGMFALVMFGPVIMHLYGGDISDPEVLAAAQQFLTLHLRVWPPLLLVFAILTLHHAMVAQRIVGPLYRIRTTMEAMSRGDLSARVTFRKKDYLAKEANSLNALLESLRGDFNGLKSDYQTSNAALGDLMRAIESTSVEGIRERAEELATSMNRIGSRLGRLNTGQPDPGVTPPTEHSEDTWSDSGRTREEREAMSEIHQMV